MTLSRSNSTVQKNECLKAIKILARNFKNAEKESFANMPNIKNDKEFQASYELHLTYNTNFKNERYKQAQKIRHISQTIQNFKKESRAIKPSPNAVEMLKSLMESVEAALSQFKEQHVLDYDELLNDEKLLSKEIEIYDKKIQNWSTTSQPVETENKQPLAGIKDRNTENCELLEEVIEFDKFLLQNGGHNGGWDEIDHNLFLKIRNKYRVFQQSYFDELERLIATKTSDQIVQHEDWHRRYLELKESKRVAIKNWRDNKKVNKNESVTLAEEEIKLNQEIEKELKCRMKKKEEAEKAERAKKLNEWRLERELKRALELEQEKLREKGELEKEYQEKMKQLEIKEKLDEYKRQKQELNEYIEMEQYLYQEAQKQLNQENIKKNLNVLAERDLANVKEKVNKLKSKEQEKEERLRRLEMQKEKVEVQRDPSRLLRATSATKNRINTPRSGSSGPMLTPRIPTLATPSWRQGL